MAVNGAKGRKKSYQARKNAGNDLFFRVLGNILTGKSAERFAEHLEDPTFDDVYTNVGVEKALSKCLDAKVVAALCAIQETYRRLEDKRLHYWYLMHALPSTFKGIDWRAEG